MLTEDEDRVAKAEADRAAAESAARTAAHQESAARTAAEKAAAELEEWKTGAADRRRAATQLIETTQLDNAAKFQTAVAAATPELKGLERGKTTAPDDILYSTLITTRALEKAAVEVVKAVKRTDTNAYRIFLTSDADLVSRDGHLRSLMSRLEALTAVVRGFLTAHEPRRDLAAGSVFGAATAAAKLIPGVLELFAANRTLAAKPITIDDARALTAVAGALADAEGDDFLQFDDTRFLSANTNVQVQRDALESATVDLQVKVTEERAKPTEEQDESWLAAAPSLVKAGQDALAVLDAVPNGAKSSPLVSAIAIELMRESDMDFILVVQAAGGSATQLINDRPLNMKDPIYIGGTVALSYRLIEPGSSRIVAAGVATGSAHIRGTIASSIELDGL